MFFFFSKIIEKSDIKSCNIMYKCKDIELLYLSFVESVLNKNLP